MKKHTFTVAFNKALTQFCTIIGAVTITHFVLTYYGLMDYRYSLAILAGISAIIATVSLSGINRYQYSQKSGWKIFYIIPLAGIALLYLIVLEPTMPYRWLGFIIFILIVGIPADMVINRESHGFLQTLKLSKWDILTDIVISGIAGCIIAFNWSNSILVCATLFIAYAIIVLWNFSINSKGPKHTNTNANNAE